MLWRFDLEQHTWQQLSVTSKLPCHAAWQLQLFEYNGSLLLASVHKTTFFVEKIEILEGSDDENDPDEEEKGGEKEPKTKAVLEFWTELPQTMQMSKIVPFGDYIILVSLKLAPKMQALYLPTRELRDVPLSGLELESRNRCGSVVWFVRCVRCCVVVCSFFANNTSRHAASHTLCAVKDSIYLLGGFCHGQCCDNLCQKMFRLKLRVTSDEMLPQPLTVITSGNLSANSDTGDCCSYLFVLLACSF